MRRLSLTRPILILGLLTALLGLGSAGAQGPDNSVYLPMLRTLGSPPTPPPPPPAQSGLFLSTATATSSADLAIDGRGGAHAAYAQFVPTAENPRAIYSFCGAGAAGCGRAAAWQSVALGERVREVQIALTAAGQPRLLIVSEEAGRGGLIHQYAECQATCTSAASWTITPIVTTYNASDVLDTDEPQRSFAISPQGTVAFVASNRDYLYSEPDKYGTYYHVCEASCADAASWSYTVLSKTYRGNWSFDYEIFKYPVLRFTAAGEPRVLARVFALNDDGSAAPNGLYYFGCAADCDAWYHWERTYLLPTGEGVAPYPGWDLALSGDRPRVALFTGDSLSPASFNHSLLYLFCEASCMDGERWSFNRVLAAQGSGRSAALALDGQGRPRMAWLDPAGDLGYAWCAGACESEQAAWQQRVVEREADLKRHNPQAIPGHCDTDAWNGHAPALALDGAGNPWVAYDVAVQARCYYQDPTDPSQPPTYRFEPIWRGAHLTLFAQP